MRYRRPAEIDQLKVAFDELQKGSAGPGEIAVRSGIVLRIDEQSRHPFEWFCWRSLEMVRELDLFIDRSRGARSFVDVGANHGIFSLAFLKLNPSGGVVSVDPSPIAAEILLRNRALNLMDDRLASYSLACGASAGTIKTHFNWHHLEASSVSGTGADDVEIEVKPLDWICAESSASPEILKIDVEGFELPVLKGAERVLNDTRLLLLEVHPERLEELDVHQPEIFEWLDNRGWKIKTLGGDRISASRFNDQIHTFWTVCER